jgi:hypothetical protein
VAVGQPFIVARVDVVARVDDIPPGSTRVVQAGERELALFNVEGRFYATQNECLHLKGPGENEFDRPLQLETFEVVVEDGEVKVVL